MIIPLLLSFACGYIIAPSLQRSDRAAFRGFPPIASSAGLTWSSAPPPRGSEQAYVTAFPLVAALLVSGHRARVLRGAHSHRSAPRGPPPVF